MARYFVSSWRTKQCDEQKGQGRQGEALHRTAGSKFVERNVKRGDVIYIVANMHGVMYLIGSMEVARVWLEQTDWGNESIKGRKGTGTPRRFDLPVPMAVVRQDLFKGRRPRLCLHDGKLDPQTLRAVRELKPEWAKRFDRLISSG